VPGRKRCGFFTPLLELLDAAAAFFAFFPALFFVPRPSRPFEPDFILMWGDDQYENFREGCVPAFCVMAGESHDFTPWKNYKRGRNVWDEPADHVVEHTGQTPDLVSRPRDRQALTEIPGRDALGR